MAEVTTYKIVDDNWKLVDGLSGLTLKEAEKALCRQINLGFEDIYITEDKGQ